jgi:hypothetical protein
MANEELTKDVLHRLSELGLPSALIDLGNFRENFFSRKWVMLVRDRDKIADVHLIQPRKNMTSFRKR